MLDLVLFTLATIVALVLFDRYVEEHSVQSSQQSSRPFAEEPRAERCFSSCSIFTVLGLRREEVRTFTAFRDHFRSYSEVTSAMRRAGLERMRLIVGIDFSASNEWQGRRTFKGEGGLHALKGSAVWNPYQRALHTLAPAFAPFLPKGQPVAAFGFGDARSKDHGLFPLATEACTSMQDVLDAYNHSARRVQRSGPTSLAPLLRRATDLVRRSGLFHLLLVLTDGQVSRESDSATRRALVDASRSALSVVAVGVGDGPWRSLEEWDEGVPDRLFDNFHFVDFARVCRSAPRNCEAALALHALMELPDQFQTILRLKYLQKC